MEVHERTGANAGKCSYMVADVPDEDVLDAKALQIEAMAKASGAKTAQEIYDLIPSFAPHTGSFIQVADEAKGQYKIVDKQFFDSLPRWEWADIFTLAMKMAEGMTLEDAAASMSA